MTLQNVEDREWFTPRRHRGSQSGPHRRGLAPLVEALEGRALLSTLAAPTHLAGTPLAPNEVSLSWKESSSYSSFQVEWSTNGGRSYTTPVTSSTTSYLASGLTPSTTYLFRVRAVISGTSSNWAGPVKVVTLAPAYTEDFSKTAPTSPPWTYTTNEWVYGGGVLQQTQNGSPTTVDRKAMLTGLPTMPNPNDIYARIQITSSMTGEYARAGVGLYTNPATGQGYDLVFTGRWSNIDTADPVHLEFLDDGVAWSGWLVNGSQTTVGIPKTDTPQLGQWYWFHMTVSNGILYGNVWSDSNQTNVTDTSTLASEPAGWTIVYNPASQGAQAQWNRTGGVAALVGNDTGTFPGELPSGGTASFSYVSVRTGVVVV